MFERFRKDRRGVAAVEMALLAPVFIQVCLSALEFTLMMSGWSNAQRAAVAGARYATANPTATLSDVASKSQAIAAMMGVTQAMGLTMSASYDQTKNASVPSTTVLVKGTYNYQAHFLFWPVPRFTLNSQSVAILPSYQSGATGTATMNGGTPVVSTTQTSGGGNYGGIQAPVSNFSTQSVFNITGTSSTSKVQSGSGEFSYLNNEQLTFTPLDINNLSSFKISGPNFGTFTISAAQAAQCQVVKDNNNNYLNISMVGTYTPAAPGSMSQFATPQTMTLSFGGSTSGGPLMNASFSMSASTPP